MATPAAVSSHARLHKRGSSLSSVTTSPPIHDVGSISFRPSFDNRRVLYEEPLDELGRTTSPQTGIKIKPYLRKLSLKEENARVDLSKSVAENSALAGLGIHDFNSVSPRSASDVRFESVNSGRSRHQRATSNGSQFSTNSGSQRPSVAYMHPMRHTPRPYTPPIAKSYSASVIGSDDSEELVDVTPDDDLRYRIAQHGISDTQVPNTSLNSDSISPSTLPIAPTPLHINSSGSFTRLQLQQNPSQSSLTGSMPTTQRSRGGTLQSLVSVDTTAAASPSSRTSMDKALGLFRGKSAEDTDPAARAASIRAARIAYTEREEAKAAKAEKEELRKQGREQRKQDRRDERERQKSNSESVTRARANSSSTEKPAPFAATAYAQSAPPQPAAALPEAAGKTPGRVAQTARPARPQDLKRSKGARSAWLGFAAWFRKRLLRLSRMVRLSS